MPHLIAQAASSPAIAPEKFAPPDHVWDYRSLVERNSKELREGTQLSAYSTGNNPNGLRPLHSLYMLESRPKQRKIG